MSLHDCLQRAIDSGDLPKRLARDAQVLFAERLEAHANAGQGAEAMAAEDVWVFLRKENIRKRRGVAMQAKAQMNIADALARHRDSDGTANAASGMRQLVEWGQSATHQSVAGIQQALEASYLRDIGQLVETHKRNILGNVRQKARLRNLVKELKGEGTGDPHAFALAQAVRDTIERARREFNAAGGDIGKLEGYDLPHQWDRKRVASVPAAQWVADTYEEIDWARIIDRATEQPFAKSSKAARVAFLEKIHGTISTGGWATREPSGAVIGQSLGKSRSDHRVLHFKTADGWLKMNEKYGRADVFSTIVDHLKSMARDTATMRILGPNPNAGLEYARQVAMKLATERPWEPTKHLGIGPVGKSLYSSATAEVEGVAAQTRRMLDMVNGAANTPEMDLFASFLSNGIRPWLMASQLGAAMLSAVSDVGFLARAAHHTGISPSKIVAKHLKNVMDSLVDTGVSAATLGKISQDRVAARFARLGIIAESSANTGVVQARMMGEAFSPGVMHRISEFTMRASGLSAWTDHARGVFQLETYGTLAENADRAWDDIDAPLREMVFEPHGITREDWEIIRQTALYRDATDQNASFLIPDDIRRRSDLDPEQALDLSLKLGAAIRGEMEFAVPTVSLRGRAAIQVGKRGTVGGELLASALMYKNYPLSLMYNQLGRIFYHKVRGSRISAISMFALTTWVGGAVSLQLNEISKGNDPRPMNEGRFLMAALIQGGGLGIFGDFLYASENRYGGGFAGTAAGPVVGGFSDAGGLIMQGAKALMSGDPEKIDTFQRTAIQFADRFGGPTNLWYLNAAFQRTIWDNLQLWADADATEAFARAEKKHQKDYGSGSYWPRGEPLPARLPDIANALGAAP